MNEDLNTPNGYMEIFETVKTLLNKILRDKETRLGKIDKRTERSLIKMLEVMGIAYQQLALTSQ